MTYLDLKTWHVVIACCLAAAFFCAMLPLKALLCSAKPLPRLKQSVMTFFKRQIQWVLPLAVLQVALGMATLFSEPVRAPASISMVLMAGVVLLAFVWLVGLGLIKNTSEQSQLRGQVVIWLIALALIMLTILYLMVNMRTMY